MSFDQDNFSFYSLLLMLGGLSIFLYGMELMSANLRKIAGDGLKIILQKVTEHRIYGIAIGAAVTAIIQSSSATTSILVSFVQSHLMAFERTIPIIMGANIGTTVTAQIVAFKITQWSLPIIFVGFLFLTLSRRTRTKNFGNVIMGLGMLFLGLAIMSAAMKSLRSSEFFLDLMQNLENVGLGILVGAIFTALIQSSSATLGIMIGMATQGLVTIEAALPLIMGANLGTCVTAILASLKSSREAKRVALAHVFFNVGGVLLFAFWVPQFIKFVQYLTPTESIPRLIANAQTYFNIIATAAWFPFVKQLEWVSKKLIPDSKNEAKRYALPRASSFSEAPELALIQSKDAIKHMKNLIKDMLFISRHYLIERNALQEDKISKIREEQVELRNSIVDFLGRLSKQRLSYAQTSDVLNQSVVINEMEHVAYKLEVSFERMAMSDEIPHFQRNEAGLEEYFRKTIKYFSKSCNAFINDSLEDSKKISSKINSLKTFENDFRNKYIEKIHELSADSNELDKVNLEVLEILRSINSTSDRICHALIEEKERLSEAQKIRF